MWLYSLILTASLANGFSLPVQNTTPQACFVFGEVIWSPSQVSSMLSSNCAIRIERKDRVVTMKGRQGTVHFTIPEDPGVHEFFYRWGNTLARIDDETVGVGFNTGGAAVLSRE
jgi:hypothetical protein